MNWNVVRRHNAAASARKARRERLEAERKARVAAAGGEIAVEELRTAARRVDPPAPGYCHDRHVWTFRGRDWVNGYGNEDAAGIYYVWSFCPFISYRQDPEMREAVPLTVGARKWLAGVMRAELAAE